MSIQRKLLIWIAIIVAVLGYGFQKIAGLASKTFGTEINSESVTGVLHPYAFLFLIAGITIWFRPSSLWKKILLGSAFGLAIIVSAFKLEAELFVSLKAFSYCVLGLVAMFCLPKLELWKKVFIGFAIGILLGSDLKTYGVAEYSEYLKLFGTTFIDLIMMIVVPLIFFSLVSGVNNMTDNALGRVGIKAVLVYVLSAMFAIALGLTMALIFNPGQGVDLKAMSTGGATPGATAFEMPQLIKVILHFIPHNAMGAMAGSPDGKPETVQTVFFAIFVGVTLNLMGEQGKRIVEFAHSAAQLMFKMIAHIIKLAPYAVFGLMSWVMAHLGVDAILQLLQLVVTTISGMLIHIVILGLMLTFMARLNPFPFFSKSIEYQALAFSTSSSKATLATAMKIAEEKIGVSKPSTSFVLPLGAAINMDGTAIYLGICSIFFAQGYGVDLDFHHYILIIFTATIASIGAAGYPGGSLVMMSMVLDVIGIPPAGIAAGIALLTGVDRILDMFRTTVNVTSDVALTVIIDKWEGTLNEQTYYSSLEELEERNRISEY